MTAAILCLVTQNVPRNAWAVLLVWGWPGLLGTGRHSPDAFLRGFNGEPELCAGRAERDRQGQAFGCPADGPTVLRCRPAPLREGLLEARNLPGETQTQHWALSV